MTIAFTETEERIALRKSVAALGAKYGRDYFEQAARTGKKTTELWAEAGRNGFLGVAIPEEYGGGGGDIGDLAAVCEELAAAGSPLLLMVVSPAIVGTIITQYGSDEQKQALLPGLADGTSTFAFSITEPDAGSNSHNIITTAYREDDGWRLTGTKTYISGVDEASHVLVVARTEDARSGKLKPALFLVPTDSEGFTYQEIDMGIVSPEKQFTLFFDDVRVPSDALIGGEGAGIEQLFAGLNPERIMASSFALGTARLALAKASEYAKERKVWDAPIGAHQAIAHPLAQTYIEIEMARLMTQKAAALYAAGDVMRAAEAANMAKYAAGEAVCNAVDRAIQTHGGNGLANEYGLVQMLAGSRLSRIAPVSREMALNFVAQFSLGLPKSY
ncbi:MAG: acyl-CoA dehydrogenase [Aeromicrobium sp.]|jgi:alkylation response protein AidB-like acyl-CoA dehydrogenase|uniref:acyl-CoA dehydrogenase family protein n=1 Tax=Aeromicrobium sp. TaxID=1871063 RepID=UPI0026111053|nr:acyl-CoA dehydrogenase family protein [Aeromicrobium sp.]MCW2789932.1 acyl-CoA dehydrogenase [Aeromicrobium sp.]MCW2826282.1 acyl-CoA dehydrogenase [Aeromicrobium sp.]